MRVTSELSLAAIAASFLAAPLAAQRVREPSCDSPGAVAATTTSPAVVPIRLYNNHVFVHVCGRGRDLDFVLDSGSPETFLDMNLAKRIGLRFGEDGRVGGIGAGSAAAARIDGVSFTIAGTSTLQPIPFVVDLSNMTTRYYHVLDGILGYDFIARNVIAIDYARRELRIYDRSKFHYRGKGAAIPITMIDRKPHVDADIRLIDGERLHGRFIVDVGSTMALALNGPFVDAHKLRSRVGTTVQPPGASGIGGSATLLTGRVASLELGAIDIPDTPVHLFGAEAGLLSAKGPIVGNIGGEVLRRFTVYFDYQARRMILEPNGVSDWAF